LIIDAMDILYTGGVDGFCIVSSDSDFTRLATRLREAGMKVFGIGEKKTPYPFIASCNKFIYIEILKKVVKEVVPAKSNQKNVVAKQADVVAPKDNSLTKLVVDSINDIAEDDGWVSLSSLGNLILIKQPDFDPRNYGQKKLLDLIKTMKGIEIDERPTGKNNISHFFVRVK
jgi:hypothetical protein